MSDELSMIQLQDPSGYGSLEYPLVLIHDGGGTAVAYASLAELSRPMYGIQNPKFYSMEPWEGGIPAMAKHYIQLVRRDVSQSRIILGGWSLGGLIALEMARQLVGDPKITVVGLVMMDSICPAAMYIGDKPLTVLPHTVQFSPITRPETRQRVSWSFHEARRMVQAWEMPRWEKANWLSIVRSSDPRTTTKAAAILPPVVLLRAVDAVPVDVEGAVSFVDVCRQQRKLGWDVYRKDLFLSVLDVPGHHFNMFEPENIQEITERLKEACSMVGAEDFRRRTIIKEERAAAASRARAASSTHGFMTA